MHIQYFGLILLNPFSNLAWGPRGQTILTDGPDGSVVIWDVDFEGWLERVCSVANRNMSTDEWKRHFYDEPYRATCPDG